MSEQVQFRPAERHKAKARIALAGPSGSGKTFTALVFATGLAEGGRVALIDSEHESASLYSPANPDDLGDGEFEFDSYSLAPPFSPARYVEAMDAAANSGYAALVVDSLSHAWFGSGGVLDLVDQYQVAHKSGGSRDAWRDVGTPQHNRLIEALIRWPGHLIATMRSKVAYDWSRGDGKVRKLGLEPIQREGLDFEFTIYGEMDAQNRLAITKSRLKPLQGQVFDRPGAQVAGLIKQELQKGSAVPMSPPDAPAEKPEEEAGPDAVGEGADGPDLLTLARAEFGGKLLTAARREGSKATAEEEIPEEVLSALLHRQGTIG